MMTRMFIKEVEEEEVKNGNKSEKERGGREGNV
jgi:hypothetical protein